MIKKLWSIIKLFFKPIKTLHPIILEPNTPSIPLPREAAWMVFAMGELGIEEVPGKLSQPHILEYAKSIGYNMTDDTVDKWCAMFVAWCLNKSGEANTGNAMAASYCRYGIPCEPKFGAIAVFEWVSGFHHVTFIDSTDGEILKCLGGNQGNKVSYKFYDRKYMISCRWPRKNNVN